MPRVVRASLPCVSPSLSTGLPPSVCSGLPSGLALRSLRTLPLSPVLDTCLTIARVALREPCVLPCAGLSIGSQGKRACLLLALMIAALISITVLLVTIALGSWQRAMLYAYYGIS